MTADQEELALRAEQFWAKIQTADPLRGYWSNPYLHKSFEAHTAGKWYFEYIRDKYFWGGGGLRVMHYQLGAVPAK